MMPAEPHPGPGPDSDAALAIAAAEAGAAVALAMYGDSRVHFDKSPTDFATDADLAAEVAVLEVLRKGRPADALVGEESGASGPSAAGRRWLVDPFNGEVFWTDGRAAFVRAGGVD